MNPDRGAANRMPRIGERIEVDASIELVVPGSGGMFSRSRHHQIRVRDVSVSGALLVVPSKAGLRRGKKVTVSQEDRSVPMRVVRVQPCIDAHFDLVGVGCSPNDARWPEFVSSLIDVPTYDMAAGWQDSADRT